MPADEKSSPAGEGEAFVRVVKGDAEPEELAAVIVVLLARARARREAETPEPGAHKANWCRREHLSGFQAPASWQFSSAPTSRP